MGRTRKYIESRRPHEICLRIKKGLPLPAWNLIKLIIESAMARAQRDDKVVICHYIWMSNHLHIILIAYDAEQCKRFYQEVQKKITESLKRLLGRSHLSIWEGDPAVAQLDDVEIIADRIGYFYANPCRANLVEDISEYPHLSTWAEFQEAKEVNSFSHREVPWIREKAISELPSHRITPKQDKFLSDKLKAGAKKLHTLRVEPNAWMNCFHINDPSVVASLNARALAVYKEHKQNASKLREHNGKRVIGAYKLSIAPITWEHIPKPRETRIFILASCVERRVSFIEFIKSLARKCKELYQRAVAGEQNLVWPPGVFIPPLPPRASALSF